MTSLFDIRRAAAQTRPTTIQPPQRGRHTHGTCTHYLACTLLSASSHAKVMPWNWFWASAWNAHLMKEM